MTIKPTRRGARGLMVQGTTSDAGKSTLVTGLCRALYRRGLQVAPFKPQNMSLNSAVSIDGGEIGRSQAVQAHACNLPPHTDMNPVLLKPHAHNGSQVIIHGKALGSMDADDYRAYKRIARRAVFESYARLSASHDVVIIEGAGSPAEINLRADDIANMGFAEATDCPVVLVADIERGGVFAHIAGTLALLSHSERARVAGFIINRFRGELALLRPGLDWLQDYTGKPVFGVLPYLDGLHLDAEDTLLADSPDNDGGPETLRVNVPALPHISNHTDLAPLRLHPQVTLRVIESQRTIPAADLIILPGTKSVCADLEWLRRNGWEELIHRHLRYGGKLIGICGGFQMLGNAIHDPAGVEGEAGGCVGLGLLDMETTLQPEKQLHNVRGRLIPGDAALTGYEIHAGISSGAALVRPAVELEDRADGAISADGRILGSYVHGLFDAPSACSALLAWAGAPTRPAPDYAQIREASIERLADTVEHHLDMPAIARLLGGDAAAPTWDAPSGDHD